MAANKDKGAPPPPDFDSPEYDGPETNFADLIQDCLELILTRSEQEIIKLAARRRCTAEAIDLCISSCVTAVQMMYVERDDHPVTRASLLAASWEPEAPPVPCSMDAWVRAAVPEQAISDSSYIMSEFLRSGGAPGAAPSATRPPGAPSVAASKAGSRPNSRPGSSQGSPSGSGAAARTRAGQRGPSPLAAARKLGSGTGGSSQEQLAAENRLREELEIRRAQEQVARNLASKDAEARAQLSKLQADLKGREYSYDHRGNVVVMSGFNGDAAGPALLGGADYRVATPEAGDGPGRAGRSTSIRRHASVKATARGVGPRSSAGANTNNGRGGPGGRAQAPEFREAPPLTQPSAMQTMNMASGVTLKQNGAMKVGPLRPRSTLTMSREEYARFVQAEAARQAQQAAKQRAVASPSAVSAVGGLQVPPGTAGTAASGALSARSGGATAPGTAEGAARPSAGGAAAPAPAPAATPAVPAAAAGLLGSSKKGPPVIQDPEWLADGVPKSPSLLPPKPPTPDVNADLVGAPDWGRSGGMGHFAAAPALVAAKPDERQRELEVGRTLRLPRDRAPQATMSPPISPTRVLPPAKVKG